MTTVVIMAGIIGTAIAHFVQRRCRQIVLVDGDSPIRKVVFQDEWRLPAGEVVMLVDAFAARLAKMPGEAIPLETERRYLTQNMEPEVSMMHSIIGPAWAPPINPASIPQQPILKGS